jgi:hypothetical protein
VIRRGGAPLGALPLAAGVMGRYYMPSAMLELVPLAWEIKSGTMRGGATSSARLDVAWRSRLLKPGVATGSGGSAGGGPSGDAPPAAVAPNHRVVVIREDRTGRNTRFRDVVTGREMTREELVTEIRAGNYPGYEIRTINGLETPMSRPSTTPDDNLG